MRISDCLLFLFKLGAGCMTVSEFAAGLRGVINPPEITVKLRTCRLYSDKCD